MDRYELVTAMQSELFGWTWNADERCFYDKNGNQRQTCHAPHVSWAWAGEAINVMREKGFVVGVVSAPDCAIQKHLEEYGEDADAKPFLTFVATDVDDTPIAHATSNDCLEECILEACLLATRKLAEMGM